MTEVSWLERWLGPKDPDDLDQRLSPPLWTFSFKAAVIMSPGLSLALAPTLGLGRALALGVVGIVPVALLLRLLCEVFVWRLGRPRTLGELEQRTGDGGRSRQG